MNLVGKLSERATSPGRLTMEAASPRTRHAHWQRVGPGHQLFLPDGSYVFDVEGDLVAQLEEASGHGDEAVRRVLAQSGLNLPKAPVDTVPSEPPMRAISLAVAQKCNLGCTYCYASGGEFNGPATSMTWPVAKMALDLLLSSAPVDGRVNVAFLGGEPLANRSLLYQATVYASEEAAKRGVEVAFSVTTNGTLLTEEDGAFFERNGYAVTVSLDGVGATHDRQRSFKSGLGTYERILKRVAPLLAMQRRMQVSARVTVTPANLDLRETLETFLRLGFHSVGFSPVLHAPDGAAEMDAAALERLLEAMIECGVEFERRLIGGQRYAFANVINALREIHAGSAASYPCGAGHGYFGVSAGGELSACHRFVGDDKGRLGDVDRGIDRALQRQWLTQRHIGAQSPCSGCWARHLCGGGCHHEVLARGRTACDYIRGWLHYCLEAYGRLSRLRPDWFEDAAVR